MLLYGKRSLILLSLASSAFVAGCDDQSADRQAQKDVERGHLLALGGTEESLTQSKQLLESASANAAASPAVQANAKSLLAQVELEAARAAQRDIDRQMMDLSRLVSEITQLSQQIATTNALVAGYRTYDPKAALASIEKNIADATGGPDKSAWFTHDDAQIPTLVVLKQDISRLEGEITKRQDQLSQLNTRRAAVLTDADQVSRAAEGPKSDQALAAYKQASDLRKQAAYLATEIENVDAALLPLSKDLGVAQGQEQVISALIVELRQQGDALQRGWQQIQEQIGAQSALARAILQGAAGSASAATVVPAGGSIGTKAAQLADIVARLSTLREAALNDARNAAAHYDQAVAKAEDLRRELSTRIEDPRNRSRPEQNSWKTMRDVMHPSVFRLHAAAAQRTLASILATHAQELHARIELRNALMPILEAAGLPMPDQLQAANLERDREQALIAANGAYEAANGLLENITDGQAQADVQNAAYVARALTLYAWSELNRDGGDSKAADEHLELARQVRNAAVERNISLPAMPRRLGPLPKSAPAPEEAPATAPGEPAPAPSDASATPGPATAPSHAPAAPGN